VATNIGSLGTEREAVDMEFEYFGETIRVHPEASDLRVVDMMMRIGDLDMDDPAAASEIMSGLAEQLLLQIHPEDATKFWEIAKKNRQQMRDIMAVSKSITEAVAGFPTGQSSDSAPTPQNESPTSGRGSLSRRERRALARLQRSRGATVTALTQLRGRPDLQTAVVNAAKARDSRAG
jgi:hypothetical protein